MKLLLIDDEEFLLEIRRTFLCNKGCVVDTARTASEAISKISASKYDGIVLDVLLEETSGFELCRQIKQLTNAPVIFLSNLSDEENQINGFLAGGDDYVHKLCSLDLFWLKVQKRVELHKADHNSTVLHFDPLVIDLKQRQVFLDHVALHLTNTEFDILVLLASDLNKVWSPSEVYYQVFGQDSLNQIHSIQVHVSRLRIKMEKAFSGHCFLETMWGKGYRFVPISSDSIYANK